MSHVARQIDLFSRPLHRFSQQEHVCRAGAAHGRGGVHERFIDHHGLPQRIEDLAREIFIAFARAHGLSMPALDDAIIDEAFVSIAENVRSFKDLEKASLFEAIKAALGHDHLSRLERFAPDHVGIAGRPRVPLAYAADRAPHIESRMQDFFGTADGPRICDGRVPVVLHLLSPAGRPAAVTSDLVSFWRNGYPQVRAELRGRYPRHPWPEDPTAAEPTRRAKPRGT